jgi:23S rRNA pseudouridine2605 synthase
MNPKDLDMPATDSLLPAEAPAGSDAPVVPRKRAPRKRAVAAVEPVAGAAVVEPSAVVAEPEAVMAKPPAKRRRKPAVVAEPVPDLFSEPQPSEAAVTPLAVAEPAVEPVVVSVEPVAHAAAEALAPAGEAGGVPGDAPRRGRNRGRGRREREQASSATPEGASAEGAVVEGAEARPPRGPRPPRPPRELPPIPVLPAVAAGELFEQVLSGAFDVEPEVIGSADASGPPKRVLAAEPDAPKLHKVLAQAGVGSRRDMEQLITDGHVTVNGEPAHTGQRISFGDRIQVNGKPIKVRIAPPPPRLIAYHKPVGEVVTHDDPQQRPTVFRKLPRLQQGKWQSVGRLDINTEGLLLFTNSGELANQLMHPRFGVEREYAVRVLGTLDNESRAKLLEGVEIDGQKAGFKSVEDGGGEGLNRWYRVVITEGRNREVRKLFDAVGLTVSRLIRIRYGTVVLPRGLKRGVWVDLEEQDVRAIRRLAGGEQRPPRGGPNEAQGRRQGGSAKPQREQRDRGRRAGPPRGHGPREDGPIPNPLQQNFDKRAIQQRQPRFVDDGRDEAGPIPNPLQQTFDKRAMQQRQPRFADDGRDEAGPIPNPLQQTFDKRAIQQRQPRFADDGRDDDDNRPIPNPLQQTYDKRFAQKPRGPGGPGQGPGRKKSAGGARGGSGGQGGGKQPDPMQTSVGFIGGDAFLRKKHGGGGGRGGRGGPSKGPRNR